MAARRGSWRRTWFNGDRLWAGALVGAGPVTFIL
jgi:hypothetical protein